MFRFGRTAMLCLAFTVFPSDFLPARIAAQEDAAVLFEEREVATLPEFYDLDEIHFSPGGHSVAYTWKDVEGQRSLVVNVHGESAELAVDDLFGFEFSADGRHWAAWYRHEGSSFVNLDGESHRLHPRTTRPILRPEAGAIYYAKGSYTEKGMRVYRNGEAISEVFAEIDAVAVQPGSERLAFVHKQERQWVVRDQGEDGSSFDRVRNLVIAPKTGRIAYVGHKGSDAHVVIDGVVGPLHFGWTPVVFSSDGKRTAYGAWGDNDWGAVIDGEVGEEIYPQLRYPVFSPDGSRVAFTADVKAGGRQAIVDGEAGPEFSGVGPVRFSADGKHCAYLVLDEQDRMSVHHHGQGTGPYHEAVIVGSIRISPQGDRVAWIAQQGRTRFLVSGDQQSEVFDDIWHPTFSGDGRRIAFGARKGRSLLWRVWNLPQ